MKKKHAMNGFVFMFSCCWIGEVKFIFCVKKNNHPDENTLHSFPNGIFIYLKFICEANDDERRKQHKHERKKKERKMQTILM